MLSRDEIETAARRLDAAKRTRVPIRLLSLDHPEITIADAYAIQKAWIDLELASGRRIVGHKIGLTSRAMRLAVGIDEPDYGVLLDDMVFADGGTVPCGRFIGLRVEAELAFVLGRRLMGPNVTLFDVLDATAWVTPALEILDARVERVNRETGRTRKVFDTISDNAANAGIVTGGRACRPTDVDLRWVSTIVSKNAKVEETGVAAGVLNNPANGIAWLADRLAPHGVALEAGEVVLAGSFVRPIEVGPGDTIQADFGPLGTVSCHFSGET